MVAICDSKIMIMVITLYSVSIIAGGLGISVSSLYFIRDDSSVIEVKVGPRREATNTLSENAMLDFERANRN